MPRLCRRASARTPRRPRRSATSRGRSPRPRGPRSRACGISCVLLALVLAHDGNERRVPLCTGSLHKSPSIWRVSAAGLPQTAVLFPGQGSQTPDIRDVVARLRPDLLELAIEEVGTDPFERVDESTRFAQPAIYCASVALWSSAPLGDVGWMAGHSMGELAALVAAGSLDADDGLSLVALRGRLMADAAGDGTMLAIVGGDA